MHLLLQKLAQEEKDRLLCLEQRRNERVANIEKQQALQVISVNNCILKRNILHALYSIYLSCLYWLTILNYSL